MNNEVSVSSNLKIATHGAIKWLCIFGVVLFLWFAFLTWLNNDGIGYFVLFVGFSLLEFLGFLLSFSTIEVNQRSIIATVLGTTYKMDWDEVSTIETDGGNIAFLGSDKCFPINLGFAGKGKAEFKIFLAQLIEQREIEVKPMSSLRIIQKNTKIANDRP